MSPCQLGPCIYDDSLTILKVSTLQMTVVELDEWIPSEQFAMKKDNITDALFGVIYAKFPSSALGHHGILIRLLSSNEETKGEYILLDCILIH